MPISQQKTHSLSKLMLKDNIATKTVQWYIYTITRVPALTNQHYVVFKFRSSRQTSTSFHVDVNDFFLRRLPPVDKDVK